MAFIIPTSALSEETVVNSQDFIPIVDSSSLTTYKTTVQNFGIWMSQSGSVSSSLISRTASFDILANYSVSASFASRSLFSISSSFTSQSLSASFANSASRANIRNAISTSWASSSLFSLSSSFASQSLNSAFTLHAPPPISASWANISLSSSHSETASLGVNLPPAATLPVTTSWALTSIVPQSTIRFLNKPVSIAVGSSPISIRQYTGSLIPFNVSGVILQASANSGNTNSPGFIYISSDNGVGNNKKILLGYMSAGGADICFYAKQGFFPVINGTNGSTFWYQVTQFTEAWEIDIVGYF